MNIVTSQSEIPKAYAYVTVIDKFMSGWGHARGKKNKLIFVCENYKEVDIVFKNCQNRDDFIYVNFCKNKPKLHSHQLTQVKTKEDYPNFYKPNAF